MEALYSLMVAKQNQMLEVQREIMDLRALALYQEVEAKRKEHRSDVAGRSVAIFLCGLLIGIMFLLAIVTRDNSNRISREAPPGEISSGTK